MVPSYRQGALRYGLGWAWQHASNPWVGVTGFVTAAVTTAVLAVVAIPAKWNGTQKVGAVLALLVFSAGAVFLLCVIGAALRSPYVRFRAVAIRLDDLEARIQAEEERSTPGVVVELPPPGSHWPDLTFDGEHEWSKSGDLPAKKGAVVSFTKVMVRAENVGQLTNCRVSIVEVNPPLYTAMIELPLPLTWVGTHEATAVTVLKSPRAVLVDQIFRPMPPYTTDGGGEDDRSRSSRFDYSIAETIVTLAVEADELTEPAFFWVRLKAVHPEGEAPAFSKVHPKEAVEVSPDPLLLDPAISEPSPAGQIAQ